MKREELISKLVSLKDYHLNFDEITKLTGYRFQEKTLYSAASDPRISQFFLYLDKDRQMEISYTYAIAIVANLALYSFSIPSLEQIEQMLNIMHYSHEEMEKFVNENQALCLCVSDTLLHPFAFILMHAIYDGMMHKKKDSLSLLRELNTYLENEHLLVLFGKEDCIQQYHDFIINHAISFLKPRILTYETELAMSLARKKVEKERRRFKKEYNNVMASIQKNGSPFTAPLAIENFIQSNQTNYDELFENISRIPGINHIVEKEKETVDQYRDAISSLVEEADEKDDINFQQIKSNLTDKIIWDIAQGAYLELLSGDDIHRITIGYIVFQDFVHDSNIPMLMAPLPVLEDVEEWDNVFTECNGSLASKVFDENEIITLPLEFEDHTENGAFLLSSVLSHYANHVAPINLYIRRSLIKLFKDAGYSERKARDFSVIIATLSQLNQHHTQLASSYYPSLQVNQINTLEKQENIKDNPEFKKLELQKNQAEYNLRKAQHEAQTHRHEIYQLQKEIDELKKQLNDKGIPANYISTTNHKSEIKQNFSFPYRTDRKIILYGGFDVFHREILKLIPDLRIIPLSDHLDLTPIRNADIVFIQTNRINHSSYWNVRDTCKTNKVPCFHVSYGSAKRCAEFIVNELTKQ